MPLTFSIVSGSATAVGNRLILTAEGAVTLRAEQSGDERFPAKSATRVVFVANAPVILDQPLAANVAAGTTLTARVSV
ncbi:MAG: hypothetical protein EXS36_01965 [Pedosphaera sp.]|nr:hypothetical protein [Pedosphaera sp.]